MFFEFRNQEVIHILYAGSTDKTNSYWIFRDGRTQKGKQNLRIKHISLELKSCHNENRDEAFEISAILHKVSELFNTD